MTELHPGWPIILTAGPVTLRPPRWRDAREWSRIRLANATWLAQWEPTSTRSWTDRNSVREYHRSLSRLRSAARMGAALPFNVFYGEHLAGHVAASNVTRGAERSATLGYWIDAAAAGRSIIPTAVALVADHCLTAVHLHRVEINIRPENAASLRVVEKLGLRREGYHERLLDIGGGWRDHISFAVTVEDLGGRTLLSRLAALPVPPG